MGILLLLVIGFLGCSSDDRDASVKYDDLFVGHNDETSLYGTWDLIGFGNSVTFVKFNHAHLTFSPDGSLSGKCGNEIWGYYTCHGSSIKLMDLYKTQVGCEDDQISFFEDNLINVKRYDLFKNGHLRLYYLDNDYFEFSKKTE